MDQVFDELVDNNGNTLLHLAILDNNLDDFKEALHVILQDEPLIAAYLINYKNHEYWTALQLAADYENDEFVKLLLNAGVQITEENKVSSLNIACRKQNSETIKLLLTEIRPENFVHLFDKVFDLSMINNIIKSGFDVNTKFICLKNGTLLHLACHKGNSKTVTTLISNGADVTLKNTAGWSPLMIASYMGHAEIVELLLEYDKNPESIIYSLYYACRKSLPEVLELLLKQIRHQDLFYFFNKFVDDDITMMNNIIKSGFEVNTKFIYHKENTLLHLACYKGNLDIVKTLIDSGADVNAENAIKASPLMLASSMGRQEIVELLLTKQNNQENINSSFYIACMYGHKEIAEILAKKGANVNFKFNGNTLLHIAVANKNYAIAELLVRLGANINESSFSGQTPRQIANANNDAIMINILTGNKDEDKKDDKDKLLCQKLFEAVHRADHINTIKALLNNNIIKHLLKNIGEDGKSLFSTCLTTTPLMLAATEGQTEIVKLLLDAGANPNEKDDDGDTPLTSAITYEQTEIVKLLLDAGDNEKISEGRAGLSPPSMRASAK